MLQTRKQEQRLQYSNMKFSMLGQEFSNSHLKEIHEITPKTGFTSEHKVMTNLKGPYNINVCLGVGWAGTFHCEMAGHKE